jgi:hypothetical protein
VLGQRELKRVINRWLTNSIHHVRLPVSWRGAATGKPCEELGQAIFAPMEFSTHKSKRRGEAPRRSIVCRGAAVSRAGR